MLNWLCSFLHGFKSNEDPPTHISTTDAISTPYGVLVIPNTPQTPYSQLSAPITPYSQPPLPMPMAYSQLSNNAGPDSLLLLDSSI